MTKATATISFYVGLKGNRSRLHYLYRSDPNSVAKFSLQSPHSTSCLFESQRLPHHERTLSKTLFCHRYTEQIRFLEKLCMFSTILKCSTIVSIRYKEYNQYTVWNLVLYDAVFIHILVVFSGFSWLLGISSFPGFAGKWRRPTATLPQATAAA